MRRPGHQLLHGKCRVNGIDVRYQRTGGNKPPLVALHGLLGSSDCLAPLGCLLGVDFDVILPDARGHGRSSSPQGGYSYPSLAADVVSFLEALRLDAPFMLGHSMGGLTAALIASLPEPALSGVVFVEPTFISPQRQREVFESNVAAEHLRLRRSPKPALLNRARRRSPWRSPEMIDDLVDARLRTNPNAFEVLRPPNPDYRALVRLARVPMLLVIGEHGIVSLEAARELEHINPLLRATLIAGAGHGLPYDQPEYLAEVVLPFLREAARGG